MSQIDERIKQLFALQIETNRTLAPTLSPLIAKAGLRLVNCLLNDGKILVCGNGGSAANCLHFSATLLNHAQVERPPLPVIALTTDLASITAITEGNHFNYIFARQIHALGQDGDILLVLSTSAKNDNILPAINAATERGMRTIALTSGNCGILTNHLTPEDIELRIAIDNVNQIHEIHLFILHCFCDLIDQSLFGQMLE